VATADARIRITAEDKSARAFRSLQQRMGKTTNMMNGMIKGFAMLGGAAGMGRMITATVEGADKLQKLSLRLGTTTEFLSKVEHAAGRAGIQFDTVVKALMKLQKNAYDANNGLKTAADAFEGLGINVDDFLKLKPAEQFELVLESIGGVADQSLRTGFAMETMGRSGAEMLQIINDSPQAFNDLMKSAESLGATLDQDVANGAAAVADGFQDVKTAWTSLMRDAILGSNDSMVTLTGMFVSLAENVREFKDQIKFVALVMVELFVIKKITALFTAMSGAMSVATFSARGLGLALRTMFGGIPGLIATAVTAYMMFKGEADETTESIEVQTEAVKELREEMKGLNLDQLAQMERELEVELAGVNSQLEIMNAELDEARNLMANPVAQSLADTVNAVSNLQTALVENNQTTAVANQELVLLEDAYVELETKLKTVRDQMDELKKSTDESVESNKNAKDSIDGLAESVFDLDKVLQKPSIHQGEKIWEGLPKPIDKAAEAMTAFGESVHDVQLENDILIDKMDKLDELFRDGKISGETYERVMRDLGQSFGEAAEDGVALVEVVEDTKTVFEDLVEGIDGSWTTMWQDLFGGGKTEDVLKTFLNNVKKMFLDTLAEIVAAYTKKKIIELFTGMTSGFSTVGSTAGTAMTSSIGSSIGAGSGTIASAISSLFGGASTSSGVVASATSTAGSTAATTFMSGAKTALANAAGFAVPLAIAAFGFGKSQRFKKKLRAKFKEVMSDPTIVGNLADGPLGNGFKELGQVGEESFVQISSAARKMFREFSETSGGIGGDRGGPIGMMTFGLKEMEDEFGNVIVSATKYNELMAHLKEMQPFVDHAQHIMDTVPANERLREGIELVNSEAFRAKVLFEGLGEEGKKALRGIEVDADSLSGFMRRGFVTSAELAQMGLENMGQMSSEMFEELIGHANDATGAVDNLARAANKASLATQTAMELKKLGGYQHGGSFIVGGSGGTDKTPVSFMATRGERVSIETPNQSKASGSDGGGVIKELRALRADLANVVAKPIVGAVSRGQLAMAGGVRH